MTAATATTTIQDISTITDAGLPSTIGTVARKRRRQILQSNRAKMTAEEVPVSKKPCVAAGTSGTGAGAQMGLSPPAMSAVPKATAVTANAIATVVKAKNGKTEKNKKQQLRYDPDVPMTKDEAAAWRREQRRKRNRESAAASRQKQKDRITELEGQIDEWKSKFEDAMKRIQQLEEARAPVVSDSEQALPSPVLTEETHEVRTTVSPCPSPPLSPVMSSTSPSSLDSTVGPSYPQGFITGQGSEGEENDNLIEISRPA